MLGRVVDATILVVRAGANDLRPVARAKAMLDQSRVQVAGVVFNGLSDDAHNWWTNYGSNDMLAADLDAPALTANRGQDAAPDEPAALNAVG
jgi:Mrp family chromosome partitioning ATPase